MSEVTIRRAVAADLPAIVALLEEVDDLHREALPWLLRKVDESRSQEFLEPFTSKPDHTALVAGTPAGTLAGVLLALVREVSPVPIVRPALVAEIETLVVARSFRHQGVGTSLVQAAFQWARDVGATRTELGVYEFNETARAFWESAGFETLSRRLVMQLRDSH
jgi:GNAT superfamily N-acetyltransferase